MSLLISSNGHLKSRWGQRGKRCACWGWEFIAGHGSTEHLENQCSGKSIWHRASSFSINFCQRGKKSQPNSHVNFFSYISLISHDLLSPSCKMQQCNMECLMIIFIIQMLQASQTWLGFQKDLSNFSSNTFSIVY